MSYFDLDYIKKLYQDSIDNAKDVALVKEFVNRQIDHVLNDVKTQIEYDVGYGEQEVYYSISNIFPETGLPNHLDVLFYQEVYSAIAKRLISLGLIVRNSDLFGRTIIISGWA